jgi:hypothetical protein
LLAISPLCGCAASSPESLNREVNAAVHVGMPKDEAVKKLTDLDFRCSDTDHITCGKNVKTNLLNCYHEHVVIFYSKYSIVEKFSTNTWDCSGWTK